LPGTHRKTALCPIGGPIVTLWEWICGTSRTSEQLYLLRLGDSPAEILHFDLLILADWQNHPLIPYVFPLPAIRQYRQKQPDLQSGQLFHSACGPVQSNSKQFGDIPL